MVGDKFRGGAKAVAGAVRKTSKNTGEAKPATTRAKRGAAPVPATEEPRTVSQSSNMSSMSGTSTGTTIVKKIGRAAAVKTTAATIAAAKKTTAGTAAAKTTRKAIPAKAKAETAAPARRVLRKRA